MSKKYETQETEPQMVSEPAMTYDNNISQLDALWALILNQAEDIQRGLEERLRHLLAKNDAVAHQYTIDELHNRIALSEDEFDNGQYSTHAEVSKQVDKMFESWS